MAPLNNFIFINNVIAKLPQQKIAQVISVCLLVYIASVAAKITWLIIPNTNQTFSNSDVGNIKRLQGQSRDENVDLSKLQSLNLFGAYNESIIETTVVVENVPETRLKLTLSGLVASDQVDASAAIIEYKSKQETYGIGDIIKGTRASLEQVLIDRVIIKQSGRLETLMLDGADYGQPAQSISNKKPQQRQSKNSPQKSPSKSKTSVIDLRFNENLSQNAKLLRAELKNDFGKITDYLRISPARIAGKIVGYRLSPGKNAEFFKLSGLKSGDIAVQMNGYDLLAPLEAVQAMSALKTERDISLLVERKNDLIEILFSID
ncbi:MAG: type II secretion system protein GspC [Colwellia sp.]|jgi:general secretion pathway protein C|nr:MAG: type II secretion system protein GspC [Colwellia sp.]